MCALPKLTKHIPGTVIYYTLYICAYKDMLILLIIIKRMTAK